MISDTTIHDIFSLNWIFLTIKIIPLSHLND